MQAPPNAQVYTQVTAYDEDLSNHPRVLSSNSTPIPTHSMYQDILDSSVDVGPILFKATLPSVVATSSQNDSEHVACRNVMSDLAMPRPARRNVRPRPEPLEFRVKLGLNTKMDVGLDVDDSDGKHGFVIGVRPGAVMEYNATCLQCNNIGGRFCGRSERSPLREYKVAQGTEAKGVHRHTY